MLDNVRLISPMRTTEFRMMKDDGRQNVMRTPLPPRNKRNRLRAVFISWQKRAERLRALCEIRRAGPSGAARPESSLCYRCAATSAPVSVFVVHFRFAAKPASMAANAPIRVPNVRPHLVTRTPRLPIRSRLNSFLRYRKPQPVSQQQTRPCSRAGTAIQMDFFYHHLTLVRK